VVGGCESVVQLLLNQGGSLSERDAAGFNAIEIALLTGHEQICRRLEEARACRADKQNNSPLTMT
jgi:ankyrin repeat protein